MRSAEFLLLAAFVGLIGLGFWKFRDWLPLPHAATTVAAKAVSAPHPTSKRPGTKAGNAKNGHSPETFELPLGPMSVSTVEIHPTGAPFPTPKDLVAGMSRAQILSLFGDPIVRVTEEQKGELFEKFYYVNDEHTLATVADLLGGFLVSAESKRL